MLAEGDALFVEEEYGAAVDKYSEVREAPPLRRPHHSPPPALPHTHPHSPPAFQHRAPRRQAVRRDARDGRALLHRSIAHCKLGRFEGESQPAAPAASRGRASPAVGVLRAPADAVADADAALRLDGGSAQAHYRRGCD